MKTATIISVHFLFLSILLIGCEFTQTNELKKGADDILLASIGGRKMYLSDVKDMIVTGNEHDSLAQLNSYVESWLKRNVLLSEAEDRFPSDLDINMLVEDYRSSLLLYNYRQALIAEKLDTLVTAEQEETYYNKNKEQFLLAEPICIVRIAQVSDKARRLERFYRDWKKNDTLVISTYLKTNSEFQNPEKNEWHTIDHYLSYLPKERFKIKDFKKNADIQKHFGNSEYFIKVVDFREGNEIPPLDYVREKIRKVIIHRRKKNILEAIENKVYKEYLTAKKIQVFTD